MNITVDKEKKQPIYMQIYEQLKDQILSGELPEGMLLPPERKLAEELGVNRTTILNAYNKLKQEEMIDSKVGQGTTVSLKAEDRTEILEPTWNQFFNSRLDDLNKNMIGKLLPLLGKTDIISFALGMADPKLIPDLPFAKLAESTNGVENKFVLSQTPVAGNEDFRENICKWLTKENINCSMEQVMILTGSQQGIDLAARVLIQPGDIVIVESPSFFLAINSFKSAGADIIDIPIDKFGMKMDRLEQVLKRYHPKCIYTIPNYQNPSSFTMSLERRKKMLELAYRYNVIIIEDAAYAGLNFGENELPSLYQLDTNGYVVYLRSFSKTICSGLRLGFMVAHKKMIVQCCMLRQNTDIHPNSISQYLVNEFMLSGAYEKHINLVKQKYKEKSIVMLNALSKHAPEGMLWEKSQGGYYFWCKIPDQVNASELFVLCIKQGVAFMPGIPFYLGDNGEHYMRLNFTTPIKEEIETGIPIICANIRKLMNKGAKENGVDSSSYMPIY